MLFQLLRRRLGQPRMATPTVALAAAARSSSRESVAPVCARTWSPGPGRCTTGAVTGVEDTEGVGVPVRGGVAEAAGVGLFGGLLGGTEGVPDGGAGVVGGTVGGTVGGAVGGAEGGGVWWQPQTCLGGIVGHVSAADAAGAVVKRSAMATRAERTGSRTRTDAPS
jgi:hypothetical protein